MGDERQAPDRDGLGDLGIVFYVLIRLAPIPGGPGLLLTATPIAVVLGCAAFTVRSYELEGPMLRIRRLWWTTPLDLSGLREVEHDPKAMRLSLRLWGNGGFFSVSGLFRNRTLGRYRAYVMDPKRAVVLRFADRVVVVSPDPPDRFVNVVREMRGLDDAAGE